MMTRNRSLNSSSVQESTRRKNAPASASFKDGERPNLATFLDECNVSVMAKAAGVSKDVHIVTIGPDRKSSNANRHSLPDIELFEAPVTSTPQCTKPQKVAKVRQKNYANEGLQTSCDVSVTKLIVELEEHRKHEVQEVMKGRVSSLIAKEKQFAEEAAASAAALQAQSHAKALRDQEELLRQVREEEYRATERRQQQELLQQQHAMRVSQRNESIRVAEQRKKEEDAEKKQLLAKRLQLIEELQRCQMECRETYQSICTLLTSFQDRQALLQVVSPHNSTLKTVPEKMQNLVQRCKQNDVNGEDVKSAKTLLSQIKAIYTDINDHVEKAKKIIEEKEKRQQEIKDQTHQVSPTVQAGLASHPVPSASEAVVTGTAVVDELADFVDKDSLAIYRKLKEFQQNIESSCTQLTSDERFKKFRFDCYRAVTTPVNAISPVSASHLRDKFQKLSSLLSGQQVAVDTARVSAAHHPAGVSYCKNILAKKLVDQGASAVESKPEAAFAIAAVIVALWQEFPDLGQLVLAHFYEKCPYLIPAFWPQLEGQSDKDYLKSLGYTYNDKGEVQKQDKFLKRMSGLMRLYAAILISRPPRERQKNIHPHGPGQGWRWLTSLLNLEPHPDICATLIYDFLEVAGSRMIQHYGRQFKKLLVYLCKEYFPRLQKSAVSSGGPVVRLELFLQEILKRGQIKEPPRMLPPNFW